MNDLFKILIWVAVVGVVFALLWWKGYLLKLSNYVAQTKEELRKCTWPTWDELKGSTVLVTITIGIIGAFTFVVDRVFTILIFWLMKA